MKEYLAKYMNYLVILGVIVLTILIIDWLNIPFISILIDGITYHMMVTEWLALLGFIITLATAVLVPLAFYEIGEKHRKNDKNNNEVQLDRMRQKDTEDRILNNIPVDLASSIIRYVYCDEIDCEENRQEFIRYNKIFVRDIDAKEREHIISRVDSNWKQEYHDEIIGEYDYTKTILFRDVIKESRTEMQKTFEIINTIHSFEKNEIYKKKYGYIKGKLGNNLDVKDQYLEEIGKLRVFGGD